jgi:hypothetical protein
MPRRRSYKKSSTWQVTELAFAAPIVMAHRVIQMATAGAAPSAKDLKEFHLMSAEKVAACQESWAAMAAQAAVANQRLALSFMKSFWNPWAAQLSSKALSRQLGKATETMLTKGIAPVHRRAMSNAKRLGRHQKR